MELAHEPRVQREPVIGWRVWRSDTPGVYMHPRLLSVAMAHFWKPDPDEARCCAANPCAEPPGSNCGCGFWGLWTCREAERIAPHYALAAATRGAHITNSDLVLGLIAGWGRIAIHGTEGFRAQYARPLCLFSNYIDIRGYGLDRDLGRRDMSQRTMWSVTERFEHDWMVNELAAAYRVPALPLHSAARSGLLAEFGVPAAQVEDIRRVFPGAAPDQPPREPSRCHEPPQAGPELTP